jgi:hypothetical protein
MKDTEFMVFLRFYSKVFEKKKRESADETTRFPKASVQEIDALVDILEREKKTCNGTARNIDKLIGYARNTGPLGILAYCPEEYTEIFSNFASIYIELKPELNGMSADAKALLTKIYDSYWHYTMTWDDKRTTEYILKQSI